MYRCEFAALSRYDWLRTIQPLSNEKYTNIRLEQENERGTTASMYSALSISIVRERLYEKTQSKALYTQAVGHDVIY